MGRNNAGANGVYLDDFLCGTQVYGNLFQRVYRAIQIGGGRDNTVDNNVFVDCKIGVHIDQRGLGWANSYIDSTVPGYTSQLYDGLKAYNVTSPPYSLQYPHLAGMENDQPGQARYNRVVHNVFYQTPQWSNLINNLGAFVTGATNASPIVLTLASAYTPAAAQGVSVRMVSGNTAANGHWATTSVNTTHLSLTGSQGNQAYTAGGVVYNDYMTIDSCWTYGDPLFEDYATHDFRIKPGSPVWATGFKQLPYDSMGLSSGQTSLETQSVVLPDHGSLRIQSLYVSGSQLHIDLILGKAVDLISIDIFNIQGRRINRHTLRQMAQGPHKVSVRVEGLGQKTVSAGLYFCRVSVRDEARVRKTLILR